MLLSSIGSYWREISLVLLGALVAILLNMLSDKNAELAVKKNQYDELTERISLLNQQLQEEAVDYQSKMKWYEEELNKKPKVVERLEKIYIRTGKDECETINNMLDDYRSAI